MADVFPYEVYALRTGGGRAGAFALISPVRALLVAVRADAASLSHDLADALRDMDCEPTDLRDIVLLEPPPDAPRAIPAFSGAWIHRLWEPRDIVAGVKAVREDGNLTLRVMTRSGWITLPDPAARGAGEPVERLD